MNLFSAFENWYGLIIGSGMVICIVIAYFLAKNRGYYPDLIFDIAIICIPLAIIGARVYYVIFDIIAGGSWDLARFFGFENGTWQLQGLAIYGGLIGAVGGGFIVAAIQKRKKPEERVTFLQMADLAFTVIILGQAIGRWGNFANQEAHGAAVTDPNLQWFPYAVFIDRHGEYGWFQATFFYESFLNFIGFALLMWMYLGKRKSFDGFSVSVYCIWYGIARFFIEGMRTDSLWLVPGVIRVSQVVSVLIVIFGAAFIVYHLYKARSAGKRPFILVPAAELNSDVYDFEKSALSRPKPVREKKKRFWEREYAGETISEDTDLPAGEAPDNGGQPSYEDDLYEDIPDIIDEKEPLSEDDEVRDTAEALSAETGIEFINASSEKGGENSAKSETEGAADKVEKAESNASDSPDGTKKKSKRKSGDEE